MMPEYEKMGVEVVEDGQNLPPPLPGWNRVNWYAKHWGTIFSWKRKSLKKENAPSGIISAWLG